MMTVMMMIVVVMIIITMMVSAGVQVRWSGMCGWVAGRVAWVGVKGSL